MSVPTVTSRDFNREPGRIKHAAAEGPVIITERGRPVLAVMPYAAYRDGQAPPVSILDALAMPGVDDIDLPLDRPVTLPRAAAFD